MRYAQVNFSKWPYEGTFYFFLPWFCLFLVSEICFPSSAPWVAGPKNHTHTNQRPALHPGISGLPPERHLKTLTLLT